MSTPAPGTLRTPGVGTIYRWIYLCYIDFCTDCIHLLKYCFSLDGSQVVEIEDDCSEADDERAENVLVDLTEVYVGKSDMAHTPLLPVIYQI